MHNYKKHIWSIQNYLSIEHMLSIVHIILTNQTSLIKLPISFPHSKDLAGGCRILQNMRTWTCAHWCTFSKAELIWKGRPQAEVSDHSFVLSMCPIWLGDQYQTRSLMLSTKPSHLQPASRDQLNWTSMLSFWPQHHRLQRLGGQPFKHPLEWRMQWVVLVSQSSTTSL